jgi:hypothetical protein
MLKGPLATVPGVRTPECLETNMVSNGLWNFTNKNAPIAALITREDPYMRLVEKCRATWDDFEECLKTMHQIFNQKNS